MHIGRRDGEDESRFHGKSRKDGGYGWIDRVVYFLCFLQARCRKTPFYLGYRGQRELIVSSTTILVHGNLIGQKIPSQCICGSLESKAR